jgi:hypothetical protein
LYFSRKSKGKEKEASARGRNNLSLVKVSLNLLGKRLRKTLRIKLLEKV